jgi:hypothetical protein
MDERKVVDDTRKPSATSIRIAMPGAPTPKREPIRAMTEPVKRAHTGSHMTRIEEFRKLKEAKTPQGRAKTPRFGI